MSSHIRIRVGYRDVKGVAVQVVVVIVVVIIIVVVVVVVNHVDDGLDGEQSHGHEVESIEAAAFAACLLGTEALLIQSAHNQVCHDLS